MKRKITLLLIFSILLSTIAPATKSYASENQNSSDEEVTNNQSDVRVTSDGIFIDGKFYTAEEFTSLLDNAILVSENTTNGISTRSAEVVDAGAALVAGTWWIPGVGEVVVTAAGVIIVGGTVIAVGSWAYKTVITWFKNRALIQQIKNEIPNRLKKPNGDVDLGKFDQRGNNGSRKNKKTGWSIDKDTAEHKGSKWKLKDRIGRRKASLDENGKVLGK